MLIDCYLNLHNNCISVRSREKEDYGTVVAHRDKVSMRNVEFVVQPGGQKKTREDGVKNVHAVVRGEWDDSCKVLFGEYVTYNPYKYDHFIHLDSEKYVSRADRVSVTRKGVFAEGLIYYDDNK